MRIKKFEANSMKEALLKIRRDLGEDALILKTRKLPKGFLPFSNGPSIEVTAALDERPKTAEAETMAGRPLTYAPPRPKQQVPQRASPAVLDKTIVEDTAKREDIASPGGVRSVQRNELGLHELKEDLHQMKVLLASILATGESSAAGGFAGPWAVLYKRLIDSEIKEETACDLIQKMKNSTENPDKEINKRCIDILCGCFPVSGPIAPRSRGPAVVALVGPTGVGKTTTIAKLAAYYTVTLRKRVSVITIDTYRIAAVEQIRMLAEILNIGVQAVFSYDEIGLALASCTQDDILFVDTAGRSQRNREHMRDLELFLDALKPSEIHLVLSAVTKNSDLEDILKRYSSLPLHRLLFTKLDETGKLGALFNIVQKSRIPVSYLTTGQSIPDDIELAQPSRFVQRLLEGSSL